MGLKGCANTQLVFGRSGTTRAVLLGDRKNAGLPTLDQLFAGGEIQRFLLTHYHMDHVQGLFPLRWGCGNAIPVYGPPDPDGCDDLYKHPGILAFQPPLSAFHPIQFGDLRITPVPLNHSKITFGYLLQSPNRAIAYLTDTIGPPAEQVPARV